MCIRRSFPLAVLSMAAFAHSGMRAALVEVREVGQTAGDDTRWLLELTAAPSNVAVLKSPDRIVLDVMGARLAGRAGGSRRGGAIKEVARGQGSSVICASCSIWRVRSGQSSLMEPTQHAATAAHATAQRRVVETRQGRACAARRADLVIAIDAGHGGEDPRHRQVRHAREDVCSHRPAWRSA